MLFFSSDPTLPWQYDVFFLPLAGRGRTCISPLFFSSCLTHWSHVRLCFFFGSQTSLSRPYSIVCCSPLLPRLLEYGSASVPFLLWWDRSHPVSVLFSFQMFSLSLMLWWITFPFFMSEKSKFPPFFSLLRSSLTPVFFFSPWFDSVLPDDTPEISILSFGDAEEMKSFLPPFFLTSASVVLFGEAPLFFKLWLCRLISRFPH